MKSVHLRLVLGVAVLLVLASGAYVALPSAPPTGPGLIARTGPVVSEQQFVLTDVNKDLKSDSARIEGTASVAFPVYGLDRRQLMRKRVVLQTSPKAFLVPVFDEGVQTGDYEVTFEPYAKIVAEGTKSDELLSRARALLEKRFGAKAEYRLVSEGSTAMVAVGKDGTLGVVFLGEDFLPGNVSMLSRRPRAFTLLEGDEAARAIAGAYRSP